MVERGHPQLSVRRQCELLGVNRNRLDEPGPKVTEEDLRSMRLLDEIHLREPTYGARKLRVVLQRDDGINAGRGRVRRLMKLAGIEACYRKPRTSVPGQGHSIHPRLLPGHLLRAVAGLVHVGLLPACHPYAGLLESTAANRRPSDLVAALHEQWLPQHAGEQDLPHGRTRRHRERGHANRDITMACWLARCPPCGRDPDQGESPIPRSCLSSAA